MKQKKTLVIGASEKPDRYSNMAIQRLREHGHPVVALGNRVGEVGDVAIVTGRPIWEDVHTITMYLNPQNQEAYLDYILNLRPERIIFNPGAENPMLSARAAELGIASLNACTLVLLGIGTY